MRRDTKSFVVCRSLRLGATLAFLSAGLPLIGCGDSEPGEEDREGKGDIALDSLSGVGNGGGAPGLLGGRADDGSCIGLKAEDGCLGEVFQGEAVPLDLYLMFDQSGSMSIVVDKESRMTRMDIVRTAVRTFLEDEESIGMGAGIGYFGYMPIKHTTCDPNDYRDPDVEIGILPGQTAALISNLDSKEPIGETPTGAAIRAACDYVAEYRGDNPGRSPAILLVTDGEPKAPLSKSMCVPTLDDAVSAAEECFEETGTRIYVLGVGPSLTNLRVIAEAGGTDEAFLADLDNSEQVLEALRAVRYAAQLPCDLSLSSAALAADEVNLAAATVAYLDSECAVQVVSEVSRESKCDGGLGWYFDRPEAPTKIHLCDATCGDVKSRGRELFYSLGCPLEVEVVR